MKKPIKIIVLLFNAEHPIDDVLEELSDLWSYHHGEDFPVTQEEGDDTEVFVFYTPHTSEAEKIKNGCKKDSIPMFGVNIIPSVNGEVIRRNVGDNPFDTRFVNFNPSTTAHLIQINSHSFFYPVQNSCAV